MEKIVITVINERLIAYRAAGPRYTHTDLLTPKISFHCAKIHWYLAERPAVSFLLKEHQALDQYSNISIA